MTTEAWQANYFKTSKDPTFQRALCKSAPKEAVSYVLGCSSLLKAESKDEYVMVQF